MQFLFFGATITVNGERLSDPFGNRIFPQIYVDAFWNLHGAWTQREERKDNALIHFQPMDEMYLPLNLFNSTAPHRPGRKRGLVYTDTLDCKRRRAMDEMCLFNVDAPSGGAEAVSRAGCKRRLVYTEIIDFKRRRA